MKDIVYQPIGIIRSPHKQASGTPIQPTAAQDIQGQIEIYPEYVDGLQDVDGFSYLILLYHFDRVRDYHLRVKPFLDDKVRGVFSTRAPSRPNPIGLSVVKLVRIVGNCLEITGVDVLDGTPLLDLKPYVDRFDVRLSERQGWLAENLKNLDSTSDDGRFSHHTAQK